MIVVGIIIGILTIAFLIDGLREIPPYDEYRDYDWNEDEEHEFYEE